MDLIFLGLTLAIILFIFLMVWRDVFMKWGIGERPQKRLLTLKKDKKDYAIPLGVLGDVLKVTVEELRDKGMSIYLYDTGKSYSINKGDSRPVIWFGVDSLCFIKGDLEGLLMQSIGIKLMYGRFIVEGNYFVSKKKAEENRKFFEAFMECLSKNLTKDGSLADEVEVIDSTNDG